MAACAVICMGFWAFRRRFYGFMWAFKAVLLGVCWVLMGFLMWMGVSAVPGLLF
jgi:hypothetical protein